MVVVCPPGHPLASHEAVTAEHLQGMDFVGFDRDLSIRKEIDRHLRQRSVNIRVVMEFDNIETIKQAVQIGAGREHPARADGPRRGPQRLVGGRSADRARAAPADRHHPPPAQGVHAHGGEVRRTAASRSRTDPPEEPLMRDPEVLVCFRPSGREAYVLPGTRLVEAAAEAGMVLEIPCGGEGLCGKCRVHRRRGRRRADGRRTAMASRPRNSSRAGGWRASRRSCGPTEVEIPPDVAGRRGTQDPRRTPSRAPRRPADDPPVRKRYVELPPPDRGDDLPDLLRLERAVDAGPLEIDLSLLREIPARLREADFRGTAVLADGRLLDFEPGNTEADAFAVAARHRHHDPGGDAAGPGHGQRVGGRRAAESADPLRRRRALAHPPRPARPRRAAAIARRRSPRPSTR